MKTVMKYMLGVAATFGLATMSFADKKMEGKDIPLSEVPAAVKQTIDSNLQGGKIDDVELVNYEGKTFYKVEVDLKKKGSTKDDLKLFIAESGELVKSYEEVALIDAPAAVQTAVKELEASKGKVDDVKRVKKGDKVSYSVEFDNDVKVHFAEDGSQIEHKKKH